MAQNKTGCIYTLVDPRTESVRYVGATGNPDNRLKSHLKNPHSEDLREWISNLRSDGCEPEMDIISSHPVEKVPEKEEALIESMSEKTDLLNGQDYSGYSWRSYSTGQRESQNTPGETQYDPEKLRRLLETVEQSVDDKDPMTGYEALGDACEELDMETDRPKKMPLETRIGWARKYIQDTISAIKHVQGKEALEYARGALDLLEVNDAVDD